MTDPIRFESWQPVPPPEESAVVPVSVEPIQQDPDIMAAAERIMTRYPKAQELQDEPPQGTQPQEGEK